MANAANLKAWAEVNRRAEAEENKRRRDRLRLRAAAVAPSALPSAAFALVPGPVSLPPSLPTSGR